MIRAIGSENALKLSNEWRERFDCVGRGGVIIIYEGRADAWLDKIRNPERYNPGCLAVDEIGRTWTAIGGNERDGALMWLSNEEIPD